MFYYILFFLSLGLSLLGTPLAEKLAYRYKFLDIPDGRKRHRVPIPMLGGLAIYISYFATLLIGLLFKSDILLPQQDLLMGIFLSGTIIFFAGLADDAFGLNAPQKFSVQIIASLALIFFGYPETVLKSMIPELPDSLWVRYLCFMDCDDYECHQPYRWA